MLKTRLLQFQKQQQQQQMLIVFVCPAIYIMRVRCTTYVQIRT